MSKKLCYYVCKACQDEGKGPCVLITDLRLPDECPYFIYDHDWKEAVLEDEMQFEWNDDFTEITMWFEGMTTKFAFSAAQLGELATTVGLALAVGIDGRQEKQ